MLCIYNSSLPESLCECPPHPHGGVVVVVMKEGVYIYIKQQILINYAYMLVMLFSERLLGDHGRTNVFSRQIPQSTHGNSLKRTRQFSQQIFCSARILPCVFVWRRNCHEKRLQLPCSKANVGWLSRPYMYVSLPCPARGNDGLSSIYTHEGVLT